MITDLPPVPSRADPSTFSAKSDLFLGALDTFGTELNATKEDVNLSQIEASASKTSASTSATNANTSANNASTYAANALVNANAAAANTNAPLWVSGTTYALGRLVYSAVTGRTYRRIIAGAGTTDPSSDAVNWTVLGLDINTSYPTIRPALNLSFTSEAIDPRITFTRASTATRVNRNGVIENSAISIPRIDYDPVSLVCKGLLIEEARTNLLTYSKDLSNAAWVSTEVIFSFNSILGLDGTVTGHKIVPSVNNSQHSIYQVASVTSGQEYAQSFYVKQAGYSILNVYGSTGFNTASYINFDLSTANITTSSGFTGTITPAGNGWYRCTVVATATSTTASGRLIFRASSINRTTGAYVGDGVSGLYIWGIQLEAGGFSTSYIPTTTTAVTRAADLASLSGTNLTSWFRTDAGTFVITATQYAVTKGQKDAIVFDSTNNIFYTVNGSSNLRSFDGTNVVQNGTVIKDEQFIAALAYSNSGMVQTFNGNAPVTSSFDGTMGSDAMYLGASSIGANALSGHILRLTYYPINLSNSELVQISTS